jgi:arginyl-tRNA synthetase
MVKFVKNGEPLKMSKRAGNFITAREVIDEVGADVLRFIMLTRKNDAPLDFDLAKVIEQSKDNPIFYVQYAHARCCSVLRQAPAVSGKWSVLSELKDESEIELIKKIAFRQIAWCYSLGQSLRGLNPTDNLKDFISEED